MASTITHAQVFACFGNLFSKHHKLSITIFIILSLYILASTPAFARAFTPAEDPDVILHNPDMGWILYENYPIDQQPGGSSTMVTLPDETFPEVDEVAVMFTWYDIEKSEGVYDFSKVDRAYDYWKSHGKKIQLRMSTESLLFWSAFDPPSAKGIPDYVLSAIPSNKKQARRFERLSYTVVDARNLYYQSRLRAFLRAVSAHFKTRPVTLIDLRGFGLWGEWHSGYNYLTTSDRICALKSIIDIWSTELKSYTLAISFSYDPDSPPSYRNGPADHFDPSYTATYADFLRYSAFDYAITKPNITLRRDGAGGAIHSNERLLCENAFKLGKAPIVAEFAGGYSQAKKGGEKWVRWVISDALSIHPNYINLLGWQGSDGLNFCREQPELIRQGLLNMGYRLVPVEITAPDVVRKGEKCRLGMKWVNRGVGRALRDYHLIIALADSSFGSIISRYDLGAIPTSKWIKGNTYSIDKTFTPSAIPTGDYILQIALIDPKSSRPILLPLKSSRANGFYGIGLVHVSVSANRTHG